MIVVPQSFISSKGVQNILVDGSNGIFLKEARTVNPDEDRYVSAHALTLVLSGKLRVAPVDGKPLLVGANQMIFLPKGLYLISDVIPNGEPFRAVVFFFDEATTDEFLATMNDSKGDSDSNFTNSIFSYTQELKYFTEGLIQLYGQHHQNHNITRFKLIEFLNLIARSPEGQRLIYHIQQLKNQPKGNVRNFMEQNFDKGLNIEDYAYLTGRSISTFHRDFKRQFGVAPKRWLINKRMEKAKELLNKEDISVTQLALEIGYENTSHFIKAFQKKYGISPKQFQIKRREEAYL